MPADFSFEPVRLTRSRRGALADIALPMLHKKYSNCAALFEEIYIWNGGRSVSGTSPEKIRPRLAPSTNSGLSASTVRVPIFAQQKWSSCAAAEFVDGAVVVSGGLPGQSPASKENTNTKLRRALFESLFLRSKNGRVAQQLSLSTELWSFRAA